MQNHVAHWQRLIAVFFFSACIALPPAQADDDIEFELIYTGEILNLVSGGLNPGTSYLHNVDAAITLDLEQLTAWQGATFFAYGLANNSTTFTDTRVGDLQTISNIDNTGMYRVYEVWLEQRFAADHASLKLGAIDLNSEFDAIETAGLFINASHGIGPDFSQTGLNGPSIFPTTSLAARLDYTTEKWAVRMGVFDAVPGDPDRPKRNVFKFRDGEGSLMVGEVNYTPSGPARFGFGYWRYSAEFELLTDPSRSMGGNDGFYAFADMRVLTHAADPDRGLNLFMRYGQADTRFNQVASYIGMGAVYTGLSSKRPEDQLGVSIAVANNSKKFRMHEAATGASVDRREIALELTYSTELNSWLRIQPDFQYIINPGMDPANRNAVVIGLRFELNLMGFLN